MGKDDLEVIDVQAVENLAVRRPPEAVLEEAQKAAQALKRVIDAKPRKVMFNNEQYLEFEDWQTVGRFYGITAKVESTAFVDYGGVKGFSARAVAIRSDGLEISAAEAECLNDEEKWNKRPKYEWRDKKEGSGRERVQIGEEAVPLFQLKSMAQTRAQAKVLRSVLAWVVVLAGYRPTPAEELPVTEQANAPKTADVKPSTDGQQKTATVSLDGTGYIKSVQPSTKDGKPSYLTMEDNRSGSFFDKKILANAEEWHKAHLLVLPTFEESEKTGKDGKHYINLTKLELVRTDEPQLPMDDGEPKGQPESILTVRPVTASDKRQYWIVQSSCRQYVTLDAAVQLMADELRKAKGKAIIAFETKPRPAGGGHYNEITSLIEAGAVQEQVQTQPVAEAVPL